MKRIVRHPVLSVDPKRKEVGFVFDGQPMRGFANEMVSSALLANGVKKFSIHRKQDAPQGIFCANGQCSQCTVVVNGFPLKSCVTPLREGMEIRTLMHLPKLPKDDEPLKKQKKMARKCEALVIGGGPSGLTATIELAKLGFSVLLVDDKEALGGKLLLQTHKFFGSIEDCYAGTRGIDIGKKLEAEVRSYPNVDVLTNSSVVGVYKDQKIGVFVENKDYLLVEFDGVVISTGARERSLVFGGNDLPGVYGAGAFQTLVNRDLVKAAERVFVVGSGNVGLIAAYHALQADIQVVGILDILDHVTGYKVHADKIRRMGVPLYLGHTVVSAEGDGKVERVTIAKVDKDFNPLLDTEMTFDVDTLLIAAGLSSVNEYYDVAQQFAFPVIKTGDADEIAEASSAMFDGRIAGLKMAQLLGKDIEISKDFKEKAEILKSLPGNVFETAQVELDDKFQSIFHCTQEIPCNPCASVCPSDAVELEEKLGNIMDLPRLVGECNGCGLCAAICPGLAVTVAKKVDNKWGEVLLPFEFVVDFKKGDKIKLVDMEGAFLEEAEVLKISNYKKYKTKMVRAKVSLQNAARAAGIQVQDPSVTKPLAARPSSKPRALEEGILCRCERVSLKEAIEFIRTHEIDDINQLKVARIGMGACGGKTCSVLLPRIFEKAAVPFEKVTKGTLRPLNVEVPMGALINEGRGKKE